jgi:carbonic anhydrase
MDSIKKLFLNNKKWEKSMESKFPGFFSELAKQQSPEFLWIGCSDSTEITKINIIYFFVKLLL